MHVILAGGGLGGLATALLLARHGHRVTVLERDADRPGGDPDQVFAGWARPGVPQARHPPNFLARSVRVFRDQAPDVLESLQSRGVIRQTLTAEPTVTVRAGAAVTDLVVRRDQVPVVQGVVTDAGETIHADFVVDAAGRSSRLSAMLQARGTRPAFTSRQDCALMYISRYYRLRPGLDYPRLDSPVMAFIGWARSMAFPADNGTFALL